MIPVVANQSKDASLLTLILQVLGIERPEGTTPPLPVDLIVDGHLPVQICQLKGRWFVSGVIGTEISSCEEEALASLLSCASSMWGVLEGTISYEKSRDILILWREVSDLKDQEELEPNISRFLEELEFWRTQAADVGCTGRDIFP